MMNMMINYRATYQSNTDLVLMDLIDLRPLIIDKFSRAARTFSSKPHRLSPLRRALFHWLVTSFFGAILMTEIVYNLSIISKKQNGYKDMEFFWLQLATIFTDKDMDAS